MNRIRMGITTKMAELDSCSESELVWPSNPLELVSSSDSVPYSYSYDASDSSDVFVVEVVVEVVLVVVVVVVVVVVTLGSTSRTISPLTW